MKKGIIYALVLMAFIASVYFSYGRSKGRMQPVFLNDELYFQVDYGNTNGLLKLKITEIPKNKSVWDLKLNYFHEKELVYGEVSLGFKTFNGATNSAKQRFPNTGEPTRLGEGVIYKIYTVWQCDTWGVPTSENRAEYFEIIDGQIVMLTC